MLAAGGADVGLAIQLRVELGAVEQRERGIVQPEQEDDPAGERPVRLRVVPREGDVQREQAGEEKPERAAERGARRHPLPAALALVRAEVVDEREEEQD